MVKGSIVWIKIESGGWVKFGPGHLNGAVETRKGKVMACVLVDYWNEATEPKFFRVGISNDGGILDHHWEYKLKNNFEER